MIEPGRAKMSRPSESAWLAVSIVPDLLAASMMMVALARPAMMRLRMGKAARVNSGGVGNSQIRAPLFLRICCARW